MVRFWFVLFILCLYIKASAQISNDSIQKILNGTEAQIKYYSKNTNLFTPIALASITLHLEILKSVYPYKLENKGFNIKVRNLDSCFTLLKIKTHFISVDTNETEKIVCLVERAFKKREVEIIGLKVENQNLKKQNYYLRMDTIRWSDKCKRARENETKWKNQTKNLEKKLKLYEHGTYWGLSLGFNYFLNNPPNYYIKPDSTIGALGQPKGISFLISAIVGYKFNEKHSFIFNVPLGDFTRNSANAIGLFNQKLAGGLGYGYHISGVSIIAIINISPYEKIAPELLGIKITDAEVYSLIDVKKYPTSTSYSPSFTLGMSYNFWTKPTLNTSPTE